MPVTYNLLWVYAVQQTKKPNKVEIMDVAAMTLALRMK